MAVDPNIKIVVVDDSGTMRIMFKQILNKAGFENLVMAVNGADALEKIKAEQPDLVISDWKMPQMDGMEFLEYVEKNHPTTKVIVITAYGEKDNYNQAKYLGAFEFLSKSIRVEELKKVINRVISRKNET